MNTAVIVVVAVIVLRVSPILFGLIREDASVRDRHIVEVIGYVVAAGCWALLS